MEAASLHLESLAFLCSSNDGSKRWRLNDMTAFCACCGAEITMSAGAKIGQSTPRERGAAAE